MTFKEKNVNPEGENATDQASSVEGFRNLSISSVLIVFTELGLTLMLRSFFKQTKRIPFVLFCFVEI